MNIGSYESIFTTINEKEMTVLDFTDYANKLLNNGKKDLYQKPDLFISVFTQAERLLCSDILTIDVNPFYQVFLEEEEALVQSIKGKRIPVILKNVLAQDKPKFILSEIITGLNLLSNKPIILTIDSPQKWINLVSEIVKGEADYPYTLDEIERASMYIAEFLRSFSTLGIFGIVLKEKNDFNFSTEAVLDCYQPITNVAKHYKWQLGLHTESTLISPAEIRGKIDFCLNQSIPFKDLHRLWENGLIVGGGLNHLFWSGDLEDVFTNPKKGILFGKIPPDANPETVLAQLQVLRS